MPETQTLPVRDLTERLRALDLGTSFIVRAPAGSGKTDLLTRRFLKLLAAVDDPEDILAITFTRAATAEMRARVLDHLEAAANAVVDDLEDERLSLARAALAQSERHGWRLLEQPHRLNIETIDSLCLRIAHGQPRLSRLGGQLSPLEQSGPLYALAARRTLGRLGCDDAALNAALVHLLELRDNNLGDCETLISGMLAQRDQWVRAFPLIDPRDEENNWDSLRSHLEVPFRREVRTVLGQAHALLMAEPILAEQLLALANYACANGNAILALLAGVNSFPLPDALPVEHWRCLCDFLLTKDGEWRKPGGLNKNHGFPAGDSIQKDRKKQMGFLLEQLAQTPGLLEALCRVRSLPKPRYDEDQWETLRHLFFALRHAVAELRVIFAEQNVVDFTELGIAAREVLGDESSGPDRLLALSGNIQHLLIDEFQDTSRSQHELVRLLVRAWEEAERRTVFLVGDPMQSIYMFRQAEVELFYRVEREGLVSHDHCVACEPVQLTTNFRSHAGLTDRWNDIFAAVFGEGADATAVPFSPSFATELAMQGDAVHVHPQIVGTAEVKSTAEAKLAAQRREAEDVLAVIEQHLPAIDAARRIDGEYRVAVLVRARNHLVEIVRLLRKRAIPFRAVELETLAERQELLDMLSLTRAMLHPMDRVAWLSVLRAPWCGLTLENLHVLTGRDDREARRVPMLELVERNIGLMSEDARARALRTVTTLKRAMELRFDGVHAASFSQWIERTWRSLGGAACVDAAGYENAQIFFTMLDGVPPDGMKCLTGDFEAELERLFAQPDPTVSERAGVQLMTIHKAKGLGFDVVIVPALDRKPAADRPSLIVSLERTGADGDDEMVVAPIGARGGDKHPTYAWVQKQRERRSDEERKRLLYVACTRARKELHLLGTATMSASGLQAGDRKSLLNAGWAAFEAKFAASVRLDEGLVDNLLPFPVVDEAETGLKIAAAADVRSPELKLRRLRSSPDISAGLKNVTVVGTSSASAPLRGEEFVRPEGSRRARAVGNAVHGLLDALSRGEKQGALKQRARILLRAAAFSGRILDELVAEVMAAVENCLRDKDGAWILRQRAGAESEASWTGWFEGSMKTLRADRVFLAGAEPGVEGSDCTWIVDYKMSAPAGEAVDEFLTRQREVYSPQLARYARALRAVCGQDVTVRFGLYYPRLERLDWWAEADTIEAAKY